MYCTVYKVGWRCSPYSAVEKGVCQVALVLLTIPMPSNLITMGTVYTYSYTRISGLLHTNNNEMK